jgi:L-aminopeptidase/D-esterase-like protein
MRTGPRNLITDVAGLRLGNVHNAALRSGVTVILGDAPMRAAADIRGGGPGTRETDAISGFGVVEHIHGLALSGGSAFGLDAATGVQSYLRERGEGFAVGAARVPIVPQAILFDLLNGGDKNWGRHPPYRDMGYEACASAGVDFALGTAGAGYGASVARGGRCGRMAGGLGSASVVTDDGFTLGALAAVNAAGTLTIGDGPHFWAAPYEIGDEFGGYGWPDAFPAAPAFKSFAPVNTTLGVVATDADLTHAELRRLAVMAQTGLARAINPVHSPIDGDVVFAISIARKTVADRLAAVSLLGAHAATVLARAAARGVYAATGFQDGPPSHASLFGRAKSA